MQISPLQHISLAEGIRRDYEEKVAGYKMAQEAEHPGTVENNLIRPNWLLPLVIGLFIAVGLAFNTTYQASANGYSNALATEYAQRWSVQSQSATNAPPQLSNILATEYAQRWSAQSQSASAIVVQYSNALAIEYAQRWSAQAGYASDGAAEYSNALPMMYAQPWLDSMRTTQEDAMVR